MEYQLAKKIVDKKLIEFIKDSIETSYNTKRIEIKDDKISVDFKEDVSEEEFSEFMKQQSYVYSSLEKEVLYENKIDLAYYENPMKYIEARQEAKKISNGMYMFQGNFLRIFRFFNEYFKNLANKYGAIEQEYPVLWPVDLFRKVNYFKEFPQQVILTANVKKSFKAREKFSKKYDNRNEYGKVDNEDIMDDFYYGLQPAVCDTCYYALSNQTDYQNKIYTTYNKVFRNEFSSIDSLDRLLNFSVRDIMFVGDKEFVLSVRQQLIGNIVRFLEYFNIDSKIESANDPFFGNDCCIKKIFQSSFRLKYEILAKLNFSNSYLAIGSINFHLDFFGKAFNIKLSDSSHVFSGCLGIGFERLVYALYCQYGHDVEHWPDELKVKLKLADK